MNSEKPADLLPPGSMVSLEVYRTTVLHVNDTESTVYAVTSDDLSIMVLADAHSFDAVLAAAGHSPKTEEWVKTLTRYFQRHIVELTDNVVYALDWSLLMDRKLIVVISLRIKEPSHVTGQPQ